MFAIVEQEMKMKDFSKRILAGQDFYPEFFFHVLHTAHGKQRYHVSVTDDSQQSVFFTMENQGNNSWKIINAPKVPDWIASIEERLEAAITENLES